MTIYLKAAIFLVVSAGFIWLSRRSLRSLHLHGFYRFFAFESILALILLNLNYWFDKPFGFFQVISWILFIVCIYLLIHGILVLRKIGKPDRKRDDKGLIGIEKTTELATVGAYRYIRHPIYSAGLIGAWGVFFKHPVWLALSLAVVTTFFLSMTAKTEEVENIRYFGAAYRDYMKQTKMFVPFLF